MSRTIQNTAQDFQQLSEDLIQLMEQISPQQEQVHQITQSLCEWYRISHTLLTILQEQANFLYEKAQNFRKIQDEVTGNDTVFRKLQSVHGAKISSPYLMLSLLTPVHAEKRELCSGVCGHENPNRIDYTTETNQNDTSFSTNQENDYNIFEGIEFINSENEEELHIVKMKLKLFILDNGLVS